MAFYILQIYLPISDYNAFIQRHIQWGWGESWNLKMLSHDKNVHSYHMFLRRDISRRLYCEIFVQKRLVLERLDLLLIRDSFCIRPSHDKWWSRINLRQSYAMSIRLVLCCMRKTSCQDTMHEVNITDIYAYIHNCNSSAFSCLLRPASKTWHFFVLHFTLN